MSLEKIMVVDDDPNICELLRLYLEKEGYTVEIDQRRYGRGGSFPIGTARSRAARYHAAKWMAGRSAGKSAVFRTSRLLC